MTQILTRGLARDPFPLDPPAAWFSKPEWLEDGQKLTAIIAGPEAGHVAGFVAPWDQCILDGTNECWTAPPSPTGYAAAEQGETLTAEGSIVRTANIGGGVNHARLSADFQGAVDHNSNSASQLMRVVYGEDDYGIWCAGALWPDVSDRDLAMVRASALSGDWRYRPELGAYDMAGAILVNSPGFPVWRARAAHLAALAQGSAYDGPLMPVYVGGISGAGPFEPEPTLYERTVEVATRAVAAISDPLEPIRGESCAHCGQPLDLAEQLADLTVVVANLISR